MPYVSLDNCAGAPVSLTITKELGGSTAPRVDAGRAFREAVAKIFVANANLLVLRRSQLRDQRRRKRKG